MSLRVKNVRVRVTYACGHPGTYKTVDGPGLALVTARLQRQASEELCPRCTTHRTESTPAPRWYDRW